MAEALVRTTRIRPSQAGVSTFRVVASRRLSPGFIRLTLGSTDDGFDSDFVYLGFDQWFRLFLPQRGVLELPFGEAEGWHARWLKMPESTRPTVRNYTMRDARWVGGRWEIDVDFVLHRSSDSGEVEGIAAQWALAARPDDVVGLLDQGRIFNPAERAEHILVIADETGLPAVEGIARSLAPGTPATFVVETAGEVDRRPLPSAAEIDVHWINRSDHQGTPGRAALDLLGRLRIDSGSCAYVIGEGSSVLACREELQANGMPKANIDFCAYWRAGRS